MFDDVVRSEKYWGKQVRSVNVVMVFLAIFDNFFFFLHQKVFLSLF